MEKQITHAQLERMFLEINGISFDQKICLPGPKFDLQKGVIDTLGLLKEQITQGSKTRLRKISILAEPHLKAWEQTKKELKKDEELKDEPFSFVFDPISIEISKVEEITSTHDYDFTIELIFE